MSRLRIFLLAVAVCCVAGIAVGQTLFIKPDSGRWVNLAEGGRNFNIEIQDSQLTLVTQLFDPSGISTWYYSQGTMTTPNRYIGTLYKFANGQCMGCPYVAPVNLGAIGTVDLLFTSPLTATLTWPGGILPLVHRDSGVGLGTNYALLGEWATSDGDSGTFPIFFAERISFSSFQNTASGQVAVGNRSGSSSNLAVGSIGSGGYSMLLDSSTSYYKFYTFSFYGHDVIRGSVYTYLKGSSPGGSLPFVAFRMKSASLVAFHNGPGIYERVQYDSSPFSTTVAQGPKVGVSALEKALGVRLEEIHATMASASAGPTTPDEVLLEASRLEKLIQP
jgi:hypothetical protein